MPYNTNDPNYQTKNSRIASFNDFEENILDETEELKKLNRDKHNSIEDKQVIGNKKFKFNKVTHKMDDISSDEVKDRLDSIKESSSEKFEAITVLELDGYEDGGQAMICERIEFDSVDDNGMFVTLQSWDENLSHSDLKGLLGKKIKITIETI